MPSEREVAGIRCTKVLEHLSDYLEGELEQSVVKRIEAHLQGCDWCEAFGQEFAGTIKGLRARLKEPERLDEEVSRRLMQRLEKGCE